MKFVRIEIITEIILADQQSALSLVGGKIHYLAVPCLTSSYSFKGCQTIMHPLYSHVHAVPYFFQDHTISNMSA